MQQPVSIVLRAALCGCALLASIASAQQATSSDADVPAATAKKQAAEIAHGDPARWYREDQSAAARLHTLQKEIGAALQEAQAECRKLAKAERADCLKQARATYQQDMAGARAQAMQAAEPATR
jgi:hypothetical protein